MKYVVRMSYILLIGGIWFPFGGKECARIELHALDIENIIGYSNKENDGGRDITREGVKLWLDSHAGDFSEIRDFYASIEHPDTDESVDLDWEDEDSEEAYNNALSENEEAFT